MRERTFACLAKTESMNFLKSSLALFAYAGLQKKHKLLPNLYACSI